ncbi:hypothetical protein C8R44DRAFT_653930 [Mycena epipterygia]|nr:hypothetical protein C8R44DRAFT_653930 [Mycena epipterygia]
MDSVVLSDQPLSLLPAEVAKVVEVSRYVATGSSAVFIWDVLNNLKDEYHLVSQNPVRWPFVAYFTSRILCLVYVLGFTVFITYPVGGCERLALILTWLYPAAIPATSLLFLSRVRAIYGKTRMVTVIFGLLWIVEFAACMVVPFGTAGANIGSTPYCMISRISPHDAASTITPTIFDTAVFVAISYRLMGHSTKESAHHSWMDKSRAFLTGAYLPSLSRSILVQGQIYYMITAISNIATSVMLYTHLSTGYRGLLGLPNITLTSVLACRVYRSMRLKLEEPSEIIMPSNLRGNINGTLPLNITEIGADPGDIVRSAGQNAGISDRIPLENRYG